MQMCISATELLGRSAGLRCNQLPALMIATCSWMRPIARSTEFSLRVSFKR